VTGRQVIGLVTIGQSPRADVVPEMVSRLADRIQDRVELVERGALDGLNAAGVAALAPGPGDTVLVSTLRDGSEVSLAEDRVLPMLQGAVDHVLERGASVVAVLCTGVDGALRCPRPLLSPGPLTRDLVAAAAPGSRLGVIVPDPEQVPGARSDWLEVSAAVQVVAASPYGPAAAVERAARQLASWRPDLVVLDCLGFDERLQHLAARAAGVPVLLPRSVLAGAMAAFI
jgi:protein AroM